MKLSKLTLICVGASYSLALTANAGSVLTDLTIAQNASRTFGDDTALYNTTVGRYGELVLQDTASATQTTFANSGKLTLSGSAQANNTTMGMSGEVALTDNAAVNGLTLDRGVLQATGAASVSHATFQRGELTFENTASLNDSILNNSTTWLSDAATASNVTLNGGKMSLSDNVSADRLTLNNVSKVDVTGDVHLTNTTVNDNSTLTLHDNASVTDTTLNRFLYLYDSSTATNTTVSVYGNLYLYDSAKATGNTVSENSYITVNDTAEILDTTLYSESQLRMSGSSLATQTVVEKDAKVFIYDNATMHETTVNNGGYVGVMGAASVIDSVVNQGGRLHISNNDGASAERTWVNTGGQFTVNSTATARETTVNGGSFAISMNASVEESTINAGGVFSAIGNATARTTTLNDNSQMTLSGTSRAFDTTINDNALLNVNRGAVIHDTTINGGRAIVHSDALATGETHINPLGELVLHAGSNATDVTLNGGLLSIADLNDETHDYAAAHVDRLTVNRGSIAFLRDSDHEFAALSIGELSGTGNIVFNIALAEQKGNFVTIENGSGTFSVMVFDSGREISSRDDLTLNLINDRQGNIDFNLISAFGRATTVVDGGVYMYSLFNQTGKDELDGKVWYLGMFGNEPEEPNTEEPNTGGPDTEKPQVVIPGVTPSTDAVLGMASAALRVVNAELDGFRAYRATLTPERQKASHVWGHYVGSDSRVNTSSGAAYQLEQHGMAIGADISHEYEQGVLVKGGFMSFSDNDIKHARGGKSRIDSYSLGAYATWFDRSGHYFDGVIKANRLNSKLNARMTNGQYTSGDWHHLGFSGAIETGYRFTPADALNVEPYLRTSGAYVNSADVKLTNGMIAKTGKLRSLTLEAGTRVSSSFSVNGIDVQPYARIGVIQELARSNQVAINEAYRFNLESNSDGVSGRYGAGAQIAINHRTTLYGEMNYRQGKRIEEPVQGVLGMKVSF